MSIRGEVVRRQCQTENQEDDMRYMMIVKASPESETGTMPSQHELDEMSKYNDELTKAGVLLAADGLHDSSKGFRVTYAAGGKTTVTDGPFAEAKELVAGFWIIQVSSRAEALEWARRIPFQEGEVEVRQVFEAEDFGA
ncbi:hypothetical protein ALI144C_11465 [Actinosynnema sp. ALI-1.44]|nr:hypothetical protein ALI144C_11465 [Actinosynnema sp. ALI-1.44]